MKHVFTIINSMNGKHKITIAHTYKGNIDKAEVLNTNFLNIFYYNVRIKCVNGSTR